MPAVNDCGAQSGNHDQRLYEDDCTRPQICLQHKHGIEQWKWSRNDVTAEHACGLMHAGGERYQGLLRREGRTDNYETEANQSLAANLKGKLLLAHGEWLHLASLICVCQAYLPRTTNEPLPCPAGTCDNNVPPENTLLVVRGRICVSKWHAWL